MAHVLTSPGVTATEITSRNDRARRAVQVFRGMQPILTGYAQAITGRKDVRVELSATSNGETDGKRILIRPPIALGDLIPHERAVCNKRDRKTKRLRCAACHQRERIILPIYHEIAHLVNNSFMRPSEEDIQNILEDAIRASGSYFARTRAKELASASYDTFMGMAAAISEYLPMLLNALEDARIDSEMFRVRPGTKPMYVSMLNETRDNGIEGQDPLTGEIFYRKWSEQPVNAQAIFGCYCVATQYDHEGWFIPEVEDALEDQQLRELLLRIHKVRSIREVYRDSIGILERLRELGFCQLPEDPEESESEDEDESDEEGSGEGDGSPQPDGEKEGEDEQEKSSGDPGSSGDGSDEDDSDGSGGEDQESSDSEDENADDEVGDQADEESETDGSGDSDDDPAATPDPAPGDDEDNGDDPDDASGEAGDNQDGDDDAEESEGESADDELQGEPDRPVDGTPEEVRVYIIRAGGHEHASEESGGEDGIQILEEDDEVDARAIVIAIVQGLYFDQPSANVVEVREHEYDKPIIISGHNTSDGWSRRDDATSLEAIATPQSILGGALMKMRVAFSENYRHAKAVNLRGGRVNSRVLGRRAPVDDPRLFMKRSKPGRRKYHVVIGIDISGSTDGSTIERIKRAAFAQAELCARMGVGFEVYAHTGSMANPDSSFWTPGTREVALDIYVVKGLNEPWTDAVKTRLCSLQANQANLDGHSLEYYRKALDRAPVTDNIIVYYTDGCMPAENFEEELEILHREIATCKRKRYALLFVGVGNDEPKRKYGLDMVRLDTDTDIVKVVSALGERLAKS